MKEVQPVRVTLTRPPGYEDVHAELVAEDAMRLDWPWEIMNDLGSAVLVAIARPEGDERSPAREVALEAVKSTWPAWSLTKARPSKRA